MKILRRASHALVVAICVAAILPVGPARGASSSSSSAPAAPEVCLDCHDEQAPAMAGTAHDPLAHSVSCRSCHFGPDVDRHVDDPDTYKPVNPAHMRADSLTARCTTCHKNPHALNLLERDPHERAGLACVACHQVHSNHRPQLLKAEQTELCYSCHPGVRRDFALTSRHPVADGVVSCMDCHTAVAQSAKQRKPPGPGEMCVTCHGEFRGPFPFEHPAAVDYSAQEGGCLNCHAPHGSQYPRLLKQSYGSPHFSLCSQCHAVPKHLFNAEHGSQWAGVACNECHSDIHGSYFHRNLLDPSLELQGCLKAGCHK